MDSDFQTQILDKKSPFAIDFSHETNTLIVFFGDIAGNLRIPPFEFVKVTHSLNANKLFIRDLKQTWYHRGLPGISTNISETQKFLVQKIQESGAERVAFVGNSMGGYAAILFGTLIGNCQVHAFAPQTFISIIPTFFHRDFRWLSRLKALYKDVNLERKYFNLKNVLQSHPHDSAIIHIYYGKFETLDKLHALNLKNFKNVTLHEYADGTHGLVRQLRDSGELRKILEQI